jgi:hypothetical protein
VNNDDAQVKKYLGISNPSGAVALNENLFIVADDEDNLLRIYDKNRFDKPVQTIALNSVFKDTITDGEDLEIDLESGAELAGTYFWIGSHSTSRKGEFRAARHRLFAVSIKLAGNGKFVAKPAGDIYTTLIADLQNDSRFAKYQLGKAEKTQAKAIGGLNIEGLAATPENGLLIGFRNPLSGGEIKADRLVNGKALVVELLNPFEVIHGLQARFADPVELDLGGQGIREITLRKKHKYLIVSGPYHDNLPVDGHKTESFRLYKWSSKSGELKHLKKLDLPGFNTEAAFFYPGDDDNANLLSDDGKLGETTGFRTVTLVL